MIVRTKSNLIPVLSNPVLGSGKRHLLLVPGNTCFWKTRPCISSHYLGPPFHSKAVMSATRSNLEQLLASHDPLLNHPARALRPDNDCSLISLRSPTMGALMKLLCWIYRFFWCNEIDEMKVSEGIPKRFLLLVYKMEITKCGGHKNGLPKWPPRPNPRNL